MMCVDMELKRPTNHPIAELIELYEGYRSTIHFPNISPVA